MHQCYKPGIDRTTVAELWLRVDTDLTGRQPAVFYVSIFSVRILQLLLNTCLAVLFTALTILPVVAAVSGIVCKRVG